MNPSKYEPRQAEALAWALALFQNLYPEVDREPNLFLLAQALSGIKPVRWGAAWALLFRVKKQVDGGQSPVRSEVTAAWVAKAMETRAPARVIQGDGFFDSREWKELRYAVLRSASGRCQACGRSWAKDGVTIHVDHIKPRSKYPRLALVRSNLQVLCEDCNVGKSNIDETDWRRIPE